MKNKKYLALDVGTQTIGLAESNGLLATPKITLRFKSHQFKTPINTIVELCCRNHYSDLVVGYPLSDNNQHNDQTKRIDWFIKQLLKHEKWLPHIVIHRQDEWGTTQQAHKFMMDANLSRTKRKHYKDSLAAQIILNNFLEKHNFIKK